MGDGVEAADGWGWDRVARKGDLASFWRILGRIYARKKIHAQKVSLSLLSGMLLIVSGILTWRKANFLGSFW
jgi:hypothetical protein